MRLLLTGDLHIGRSSTRVPDHVPREDVRVASAWTHIVDLAIEECVSLLCISGDLADQDNKFWEAIGPLQRGIDRLAEAEIRTIAVAGNHDFDVLGRLADQLAPEHFTLIGRGGEWERITISQNGQPALHIDGWSFSHEHVRESPLDSYNLSADPAVPVLGLVHGDLDVSTSPYAPLQLARLQGMPPAAWLLGHIHVPRLVAETDGTWVLYPGSPQALDPGETGLRGPWIVSIEEGTFGVPKQHPISSVYYGECEIDVSEALDEADLETLLLDRLREEAERIAGEAGAQLTHISLRLHVVGSTPVSDRALKVAVRAADDLSLPIGSASVSVEETAVATTPAIDLEEYARIDSAPGALARLLLALDQMDTPDEVEQLIGECSDAVGQIERNADFVQLARRAETEGLSKEYLKTQTRALLSQLVTDSL